ncbi:unnamed protein product [Clonostachys solani]|uniref:Uncharacterized protein n=1 Tax=Clonostachys solani TaxID=160281 RepID=A0A9N9Z6H3_9HYPO|nr:unnamed protein product [Clonostachys solani]
MTTLKEIATDYPGEGIVVMSASLLLLDVVGEALTRKALEEDIFKFPIKEYNGTQAVRDRTSIIKTFNDSTGTRSDIDKWMSAKLDDKTRINSNLYGAVVRSDQQLAVMPQKPSREQVLRDLKKKAT